jgi:hypothetical protein
MTFLVGLLIAFAVAGSLVVVQWRYQDQLNRMRDRAKLRAVESQMRALRASLRITQAEHRTRQRMQAEAQDVFANPTTHEEPEEWRS